jgi:phytoene desaturase
MTNEVAVIGSGPAGLTSACLLAKQGYKVIVYESNSTYGGKLGTLNMNGSIFDTGPSLLTEPQIIDNIYLKCSKNPRNYWNYTKLSDGTNYFWPDGTAYQMPGQKDKIIISISKQFDISNKKVVQYFNTLQYQYCHVAPLFLDQSINIYSISNLKHIYKLIKTVPLFFKTANNYNKRVLTNKKAVQIFNRFATYSGSDPYKGPALLNLAGSPELVDGVYYPFGGMRSIVDGLYNLAIDLGVKFEFNSKIEAINTIPNGLSICTKSDNINYQKVVYAGDYANIFKLLSLKHKFNKYNHKGLSTSGLVFYWQVKGVHSKLGLHNIIFSQDYKEEFSQLNSSKISDDPTIYINITSKQEPKLTKKGYENWFVMLNVPAGYNPKDINKTLTNIKLKIENTLGYKIIINAQHTLTPKLIEQNSGSYLGAIYGRDSNSALKAIIKPTYNFKGIKGLYCVGGSTHPGGGVPLSIRSAKIMADNI